MTESCTACVDDVKVKAEELLEPVVDQHKLLDLLEKSWGEMLERCDRQAKELVKILPSTLRRLSTVLPLFAEGNNPFKDDRITKAYFSPLGALAAAIMFSVLQQFDFSQGLEDGSIYSRLTHMRNDYWKRPIALLDVTEPLEGRKDINWEETANFEPLALYIITVSILTDYLYGVKGIRSVTDEQITALR